MQFRARVATICLAATVLSISLGAFAALADDAKVRLVSTVWPPFTDIDDRPRLASELVHEALRRAGVEAQTTIVADGLLVASMRDGTHVGSGALWYSAERAEFLLYSKPYMENRLVLVGRKGSDVSAASFTGLAGKRIALVNGYAYGPEVDDLRQAADPSDPTFVIGESIEQNLRRLLDGAVDYTVIDQLVIRYIVKQYQESARANLEIGTTPLVKRTLHFALRKDVPDAASIVRRFNDRIDEMLSDGTYHRILDLTWIRVDVDGDGQPEMVLAGDRAGVSPPTDAYQVEPIDAAMDADQKKVRFMIGEELYEDWQTVPDRYKTAPLPPDPGPRRSAVPLFKIRF